MSAQIQTRASFDFIRYANCWEDADVLVSGFNNKQGGTFFSIASSGDNTLSLLTLNPSCIIAADLSAAQLACLELRMQLYKSFSYEQMKLMLGYADFGKNEKNYRIKWYKSLRNRLSERTSEFLDTQINQIESGIIHAGKFEHYFLIFRKKILPLVHSDEVIGALLEEKTQEQREEFYCKKWNSIRWRIMFSLFFSRTVMGWAGRSPQFFDQVDGPVASRIFNRVEYALSKLSTHDNPYLHYILRGTFGQFLPHCAREEHFQAIRDRIDRIEIVHGSVNDAVEKYRDTVDAFNLSDIFEYMDTEEFRRCAQTLLNAAAPGARLAYWNMLVPRSIAEIFPDQVTRNDTRSHELFLRDKAFFYQNYHLDEVNR